MNDAMTPEKLQKLIDRIGTYRPRNDNWISTPAMWTYELQHNPQNFRRNENNELIWLGYKVETIMTFNGAEEKFWALADKIIPKENSNDT